MNRADRTGKKKKTKVTKKKNVDSAKLEETCTD